MYDFAYHRPDTIDEAFALLAGDTDFKLLAGGMSLIPALKLRLARHIHASAEYRAHCIRVLAKRALLAACSAR
jgi:CO/xanthine dehydrogenase FAD-binding subunit